MPVMTFISFALLSASTLASGRYTTRADMQANSDPVVDVRLAPPHSAQPQVAAELRVLEHSRRDLQARFWIDLNRASSTELNAAALRIDSVIKRMMSAHAVKQWDGLPTTARTGLLEAREREGNVSHAGVKLNLFPVPPPSTDIQMQIERIENKLSFLEESLLNQAQEDMQHISDIVVTELSSKLARTLEQLKGQGHVSSIQMAFIAQRTSDLVNVRIAASREAFPTIRFLVEDMERRLDKSESQEMAHVIEFEKALFESEIAYADHALNQHIGPIGATTRSAVDGARAL